MFYNKQNFILNYFILNWKFWFLMPLIFGLWMDRDRNLELKNETIQVPAFFYVISPEFKAFFEVYLF